MLEQLRGGDGLCAAAFEAPSLWLRRGFGFTLLTAGLGVPPAGAGVGLRRSNDQTTLRNCAEPPETAPRVSAPPGRIPHALLRASGGRGRQRAVRRSTVIEARSCATGTSTAMPCAGAPESPTSDIAPRPAAVTAAEASAPSG